jgi:hypothetical protein
MVSAIYLKRKNELPETTRRREMTPFRLQTAQEAAARRQFEKRLDPACYRCRKEGSTWFAQGPTNIFQFRLEMPGNGGTVLCCSDSGMVYRLTHDKTDNTYGCSCPAAQKNMENPGGCKHTTALTACIQAARMGRELAK